MSKRRISDEIIQKMIREAIKAREHSYSPYSHFKVGACAYMGDGKLYSASNVENASYPCGSCAERNALFRGVNEGERRAYAIAIVGGMNQLVDTFPCGLCRQTIREFADPADLLIIIAKSEQEYKTYLLDELLPESFGPEDLK